MKFINYLESMAGIGIYPLISLLLFFAFFVGLFTWVFFMDKKLVNKMGNLPLEDDAESTENAIGI
jgi:cytochrome c oxidase cbb3-type subunit 3